MANNRSRQRSINQWQLSLQVRLLSRRSARLILTLSEEPGIARPIAVTVQHASFARAVTASSKTENRALCIDFGVTKVRKSASIAFTFMVSIRGVGVLANDQIRNRHECSPIN